MHAIRSRVPWPTATQLGLLRVGLWDAEAAAATWEDLRPDFVLDDVWDVDTYRLLPLVYQRLSALAVDDPVLTRLKGVHRREWYRNRVQLAQLAPVLDRLDRAGIDTIVLDGVPLATRYYQQLGARQIDHVSVLVRTARASAALELLAADGWLPAGRSPGDVLDVLASVRSQSARRIESPDGAVVAVHWHLGAPFVLPGRELRSGDVFWERAQPLEVEGVSTRALTPSDQLLHVLVNGLVGGDGGQARWCADAFVVLASSAADIDWDRFVALAESRRVAFVAAMALDYLVDALQVTVPPHVRTRLSRSPRTRLDEHAFERSLAYRRREARPGLVDLGPAWSWRRAKLGPAEAARDLPTFLQDSWRLGRPIEVPAEAIRRLGRRLRRRFEARR